MTEQAPEGAPSFTTGNGRILRPGAATTAAAAAPASPTTRTVDPALRDEMLFRTRREEGHEISVWWPISAFLAVSILAVLLLGWVPGGA